VTTRTVKTPADIDDLSRLLRSRALPVTVTITAGEPRTTAQNRLQRAWCRDVAEQLGDRTAEDVRAYSKLHFGVPILRADSEEYTAVYDRLIRPLPYEVKLAYMAVPLDFAVTRAMTTKQLTRYLDAMAAHWSGHGVQLTDPGALPYA
jgi:hypothetical protein